MISLTIERGFLILKTPYDAGLVDDLKRSIPIPSRVWNPKRKVWEIAYMHGQDVVDVVRRNLGVELAIPKQHTSVKPKTETRLLKIEYIGSAKERDDGSMLAFAWCEGGWSVVLSLEILREWFEGNGEIKPDEAPTRYGILGVSHNATDKEIKKAWRIGVMTWHPDKNDDPEARNQFELIQETYEILSNSVQRRKYDASLYFQVQAEKQPIGDNFSVTVTSFGTYRPPKRCGWLTVEGKQSLGRFIVNRILRWDDITENGLTMISYWPKRGNAFEVEWI